MVARYLYFTSLCGIFLTSFMASGQVDPAIEKRLEKRTHTFQSTTLPYRLYIPDNYSIQETYPLLIFLHGARWAGTDNVTQLDNELALYWINSTRQAAQPCFVVYPQIPVGSTWEKTSGQVETLPASEELATVDDLVSSLLLEFDVDKNRIYVCGKSIGASGAYGMVVRYPERYAAAVPAAGYYLYRSIDELAKTSFWIFHNKDDNTVPVDQSRYVVSECAHVGAEFIITHCNPATEKCTPISEDSIFTAIRNGARHMYSEFDDSGHQLEPNVVATFGLYEWVMAQRKTDTSVGRSEYPGKMFELYQNYPNPFNLTTVFAFDLEFYADVNLTVYNSNGQVAGILLEQWRPAGRHEITWQPDDLSSGTYFYRLSAGPAIRCGRCVLVK